MELLRRVSGFIVQKKYRNEMSIIYLKSEQNELEKLRRNGASTFLRTYENKPHMTQLNYKILRPTNCIERPKTKWKKKFN